MKWVLVLVWMDNGIPSVENVQSYHSMYDCFYGFEKYEDTVPDKGFQLICIEDIEHE